MAGGRNLMSKFSPYIHSNYENFQSQHNWGAGFGAYDEKYYFRLNQQINKISEMAQKLKDETRSFLGIEPNKNMKLNIRDFLAQTTDADDFHIIFADVFLKHMQSERFSKIISDERERVLRTSFEKFFKTTLSPEELNNMLDSPHLLNSFMELLVTKENFFNKTAKEQVKFFAQGGQQVLGLDIETLGLKKFAEEIFNACS
jgi:hypothetical protein